MSVLLDHLHRTTTELQRHLTTERMEASTLRREISQLADACNHYANEQRTTQDYADGIQQEYNEQVQRMVVKSKA